MNFLSAGEGPLCVCVLVLPGSLERKPQLSNKVPVRAAHPHASWGLSLPRFLWSARIPGARPVPILRVVSDGLVQRTIQMVSESWTRVTAASWSVDADRVKREALRPIALLTSGRPWRQTWFLVL